MPCRIFLQGHFFLLRYCEYPFDLFRRIYYNRVCDDLTESSKSPASIVKSNKQWVGMSKSSGEQGYESKGSRRIFILCYVYW